MTALFLRLLLGLLGLGGLAGIGAWLKANPGTALTFLPWIVVAIALIAQLLTRGPTKEFSLPRWAWIGLIVAALVFSLIGIGNLLGLYRFKGEETGPAAPSPPGGPSTTIETEGGIRLKIGGGQNEIPGGG